MAAKTFDDPHDPDAVEDYGLDWSARLGTDTIDASTWAITPSGLNQDSDDHDTTSTTIWVSGGTLNVTYSLTNHVTTAGGRQWDWTVKLKVKET
jgi:hypothetical protein